MRPRLPVIVAMAILASPVMAQNSPKTTESPALTLKVRPSGTTDADSDNRARQERLAKRMEENDFLFRSSCMQCGDAWTHTSYAPFEPLRSLRPSSRLSTE